MTTMMNYPNIVYHTRSHHMILQKMPTFSTFHLRYVCVCKQYIHLFHLQQLHTQRDKLSDADEFTTYAMRTAGTYPASQLHRCAHNNSDNGVGLVGACTLSGFMVLRVRRSQGDDEGQQQCQMDNDDDDDGK
jgi:hypothetical protein